MRRFYEPAQNLVNESNLLAAANRMSVGFRLSRNLIGLRSPTNPYIISPNPFTVCVLIVRIWFAELCHQELQSATLRLRKLNVTSESGLAQVVPWFVVILF